MEDIKNLFDLNAIKQIASNTVPVIPSISFLYLYWVKSQTYLLVLGLCAMALLTFYINMYERTFIALKLKIPSFKAKTEMELGKKVVNFLMQNHLFVFMVLASILVYILAFVILLINPVDRVAWTLLLLCIFSAFYYITSPIASIYTGFKYGNIFRKSKPLAKSRRKP